MSYKYFNNPKFPDLVAAIKSQPMMFGKMLIEINCLSYLSGKTSEDKGFDDKQLAQITEALEGASENVDIIFAGSDHKNESQFNELKQEYRECVTN